MTLTSSARLLSPEEILIRQAGQAERLKFADTASVFADRAIRLRQLAAGHSMRDFLVFMADVVQAQHKVLGQARTLALPTQEQVDAAAGAGVALLGQDRWPLGPAWQADLDALLEALLATQANGPVQTVLQALTQTTSDWRQQQAQTLLAGGVDGLDMAAAPLLGAALQVHYTRLVAQTRAAYPGSAFGLVDDGRHCPCCGSEPVASVRRLGAEDGGTRYLHCALCESEWHMVRIKCSHCESTKGIHYEELERTGDAPGPTVTAAKGAVRAECCDECGRYLKIMAMDKDPQVDPVADDLATVALDLLVSEDSFQRHGANLLLQWGEPPPADEPARTP